jgi:hypothetical protein
VSARRGSNVARIFNPQADEALRGGGSGEGKRGRNERS